MSSWRRILLVGFGVLSLSFLFVAGKRVAERGRFAGAYSSYGAGPRGARALFLLARELGRSPGRWSQDLARLPRGAVLVALGGCDAAMARSLSRYEREELVRWVHEGGVLLVAGARDYLPGAFGVRFEREKRCSAQTGRTASQVWAVPVAEVVQGMSLIPFRRPGRIEVLGAREHEVLVGVPASNASGGSKLRPLAVTAPHGRGRLIVLASASMLENRAVLASDGGALFTRLLDAYAPGARVLFDEYHLGVGERRTPMLYLRQQGAIPFLLQAVLAGLFALWRAGARFGGVRTPPNELPSGTASFVAALGRLYQGVRDPAAVIDVLSRQALWRIARHHRVPSPASLERALREQGVLTAAVAVSEIAMIQRSSGVGRSRLAMSAARIDAAVVRATRTRSEAASGHVFR